MSMVQIGVVYDPKMLVTKQEMRDECDINKILVRFRKTQLLSHVNQGVPQFGDVSGVTDFRSAIERVQQAQEFFAGLPANVRTEFRNDPIAFVDAFSDEGQRPRLEALGLVPKRVVPSPGTETAPGTVSS